MTKAEFARRVGLTRGRISQLVAEGMPTLADGRIAVDDALRWMEEHLDPARCKLSRLSNLNTAIKGEGEGGGEGEGEALPVGTGSLAEARRQYEWARSRLALLRYEQARGALVDRQKACDLVFRLARQERDAWLNWPARVAALMAAELGVETHLMQKILESHIRAHLAELTEVRPDFR